MSTVVAPGEYTVPGTTFNADVLAALELAARPQWLCWRYELRDGDPTKPPVDPRTGRRASSINPATWATLDVAVGRALREGWGVGFVFTSTDPFAGVDLDKCRDPETGAVAPWAASIVRAFAAYSEVSPSGSGVKVICRGAPRHNGRKATADGTAIEVYGTARYFTLTGAGEPQHPIRDAQVMLDRLCDKLWPAVSAPPPRQGARRPITCSDQMLIERARKARNGDLFSGLWAGEWQGRYGSQSEADLALCGILAFWAGGDAARVDALFRRSGLYRSKWERRDYRAWTLARVCGGGRA